KPVVIAGGGDAGGGLHVLVAEGRGSRRVAVSDRPLPLALLAARDLARRRTAEQRGLPRLALAPDLCRAVDGAVDQHQQDGAVAETVTGAAAHQRLEHAPVEVATAAAQAEIEKAAVGTAGGTALEDRLDHLLADVLDVVQPVEDLAVGDLSHREAALAAVDVGGTHHQPA